MRRRAANRRTTAVSTRYRMWTATVTALAMAAIGLLRLMLPGGRFGPSRQVDTNAIHRLQTGDDLRREMLVDINLADAEELQRIKGVGPILAQAIVDWRERNGPFARVEDLLSVEGIGPSTLEDLRGYCTVEEDGDR